MKFTASILASLALLGTAIVGCSKSHVAGNQSRLTGEATFDPAPATDDQDSIAAQLKRYKGQTKFLNPYTRYALGAEPSARSADRSAMGGGRDIQESDIFKVGKPGSKLLFLLNNFISVTREPDQDWDTIVPQVEAAIREHFTTG